MAKSPTDKQHMRQDNRDSGGRYAVMSECELCKKRIGSDYCSDPRCDEIWHGRGLVLCEKCATRLYEMDDRAAYQLLTGEELVTVYVSYQGRLYRRIIDPHLHYDGKRIIPGAWQRLDAQIPHYWAFVQTEWLRRLLDAEATWNEFMDADSGIVRMR